MMELQYEPHGLGIDGMLRCSLSAGISRSESEEEEEVYVEEEGTTKARGHKNKDVKTPSNSSTSKLSTTFVHSSYLTFRLDWS
jgi:hypothetical protein